MNCAVTGASGYVGSVITRHLRQHSFTVYELQRDTQKGQAEFRIPYSLEAGVDPQVLRSIDILIHCAYDFGLTTWSEIYRVNVLGARRLFETARQAGVKKLIFISTMSAFDGCKSLYGRAKQEVEAEASKFHLIVVKPGLVYGPSAGGMVGALLETVTHWRVVPLLDGGSQIFYLIHENDLGQFIRQLTVRDGDDDQPFTVAYHVGMSLKQILEILAEHKKRRIFFLPVPWQLLHLGLKATDFLHIPTRFRGDTLTSLLNQNARPDFSQAQEIGVRFRAFNVRSLAS